MLEERDLIWKKMNLGNKEISAGWKQKSLKNARNSMYHKMNLINIHEVVLKGGELKAIGKSLAAQGDLYDYSYRLFNPLVHFRSIFNGCVLYALYMKLTGQYCTFSLYQATK